MHALTYASSTLTNFDLHCVRERDLKWQLKNSFMWIPLSYIIYLFSLAVLLSIFSSLSLSVGPTFFVHFFLVSFDVCMCQLFWMCVNCCKVFPCIERVYFPLSHTHAHTLGGFYVILQLFLRSEHGTLVLVLFFYFLLSHAFLFFCLLACLAVTCTSIYFVSIKFYVTSTSKTLNKNSDEKNW